jgi:phosphate acyltransferase
MSDTPRIVVDAAGGTGAPLEPVRAAAAVSRETSINVVLVGDAPTLRGHLQGLAHEPSRLSVVHAPLSSGQQSLGHRYTLQRAALTRAAELVGAGEGDALVSAGARSLLVAAANAHIPRVPQVRSPALAAVYPTRERSFNNDRFALILDVGATVHATSEELLFFAYMGHAYARAISKVPAPAVALLNMSEDADAGDDVLREAYRLMKDDPRLNFIGNVSGDGLPRGVADVIVCEGLVGNVVARVSTGLSDVMGSLGEWAFKQGFWWRLGLRLLSSGVREVKRLTDYHEYGGAPYLGFRRMVIKVHGHSSQTHLVNAIKVAAKAVRDGVTDEIERAVLSFTKEGSASWGG